MKLGDLLNNVQLNTDLPSDGRNGPTWDAGEGDVEIRAVTCRAQDVVPGGLFVAIKGFSADGHDFIGQAVEHGAAAVVCEHFRAATVPMVAVTNSRKALASISANFYGHPSRHLTVIGITGTNGKTTTSYLIESILQAAGLSSGVIGTINYRYNGRLFDNPITTPESIDLQRIMSEMRANGVTHVVMEVSSHALDLFRVHDCFFDVGVFTNFTQDHLDYHKEMAAYWACKRMLFTELLPASGVCKRPRAVFNGEDPKGRELANNYPLPFVTTGQRFQDTIRAYWSHFDLEGIAARVYTPQGDLAVRSPLVGRHNLENILSAVGVGISLSLPLQTIRIGIENLHNVPGRLERVPNTGGRFVYVDYAHTPDALENALLALRALTTDRIICVFGCGGDRDRAKRPLMGAIAGRLSDLAVVTSDNPRTEPPEQIIAEILGGVRHAGSQNYNQMELKDGFGGKGYCIEPDRRAAIQLSVRVSRAGDTILIAGKGHEPYQIIGKQKFPFDDREEAVAAFGQV
jgi:UDP-N-acetylmuramoyl-L-alanyl-D-glutamate--2,6-diaminopimelate ligase